MKKIIFLFITIFGIYLIYSIFNYKVNYVSISDGIVNNYNNYIKKAFNNKITYINDYFKSSSVLEVYQDIRNNQTITVGNEIFYLKKILRESDILVISVGMEELSKIFDKYDMKKDYDYFSELFKDIKRLTGEIKKYSYGRIIFLGYFNPTNYYDANIDEFFYNVNSKLSQLMTDNDIIYLDLYELVKENNYKLNNSTLNDEAGRIIANRIIKYIK